MKKEQVFSPEILSSPHCLLHGSMRKHLQQMQEAYDVFKKFGIEATPDLSRKVVSGQDSFVLFDGENGLAPSTIEGKYLQNIYRNNPINFSYFVNPDGYMGQSASLELGITTSNIPIYFLEKPQLNSYYVPENSIWSPQDLAIFIKKHKKLPQQSIKSEEWQGLNTHKSVVAVGAVIEYKPKQGNETQILLVQTHKWGNRFSIVGEKMERDESIEDTLIRGVYEETGLKKNSSKELKTFNQINNSGYHLLYFPRMLFVDHVVTVSSRRVTLNDEAQYSTWMPAREALDVLPLEPNARHILKIYLDKIV